MKYFSLLLLLTLQTAWAVKIQTPTRSTAQNSAETKIIFGMSECLEKYKTPEALRKCAKPFISEKLSPVQFNRLVMWFIYPFELKHPEACSALDTKFIPKETMKKTKSTICSEYSFDKMNRRVIFLFTTENGKPKLHNIHEK